MKKNCYYLFIRSNVLEGRPLLPYEMKAALWLVQTQDESSTEWYHKYADALLDVTFTSAQTQTLKVFSYIYFCAPSRVLEFQIEKAQTLKVTPRVRSVFVSSELTSPSTFTSFCFQNECWRLFSGQKRVTVGFSLWWGINFAACDYFRSTSLR